MFSSFVSFYKFSFGVNLQLIATNQTFIAKFLCKKLLFVKTTDMYDFYNNYTSYLFAGHGNYRSSKGRSEFCMIFVATFDSDPRDRVCPWT